MKLFDVTGSPNCRKVRVLARELSIPLEIVPVDLSAPRAPDYLAENPTGKVPTLVDGALTIWESGAILVHLAEKEPERDLLPRDAHSRSVVFRWLFFAATHVQPWVSLLGQERVQKPRRGEAPDAGIVALAERELSRFMPIVEDALSRSPSGFLGERYSIADIFVGCGLEGGEARGIVFARWPAIAAWRERLRARPAWAD